MATRKPKTPGKPPRNEVRLVITDVNDTPDDIVARTLTRPEVQAAAVIQAFEGDNHEVNALIRELTVQAEAVRRGDMGRAETMLIAQAHVLDEIFANLARRSHANMKAGYLDATERYMRLALKAQSQCRTTLETLAEIKNPRPVAFVKQANIAHGPQQVNNGTHAPRTRENEIEQSKLSEVDHELLQDARASGSECGTVPPASALGEIHGAKVGRG